MTMMNRSSYELHKSIQVKDLSLTSSNQSTDAMGDSFLSLLSCSCIPTDLNQLKIICSDSSHRLEKDVKFQKETFPRKK